METVFQNNNRFASADCCWTLIIEVKMASLLWQGSDRKRAMDVQDGGGGGGGYCKKNWVWVCDPLPKTLTLFMTKICYFPYPIYDLTKHLIPNL